MPNEQTTNTDTSKSWIRRHPYLLTGIILTLITAAVLTPIALVAFSVITHGIIFAAAAPMIAKVASLSFLAPVVSFVTNLSLASQIAITAAAITTTSLLVGSALSGVSNVLFNRLPKLFKGK